MGSSEHVILDTQSPFLSKKEPQTLTANSTHLHCLPTDHVFSCPLACPTSLGRDLRFPLPTPLTPASCLRTMGSTPAHSSFPDKEPQIHLSTLSLTAACLRIVGPTMPHAPPLQTQTSTLPSQFHPPQPP